MMMHYWCSEYNPTIKKYYLCSHSLHAYLKDAVVRLSVMSMVRFLILYTRETNMSALKKPRVLFYPSAVYHLAQFVTFPINCVINGLCYLQPSKSEWNEDGFEQQQLLGSGKSLEQIKAEILSESNIIYNEEDLVRLYDALPNANAKTDLVNRTWNGKILRTNGSVLDLAELAIIKPLSLLGVKWGKRYRTQHQGDPLLFRWADKFYFPIPIWGNVGMTDIRWRGQATATMNYDHQPWKDYFKVLSNEQGHIVLLGVWTHRHIAGGWFTLTLNETVPTHPEK
ncbi:MAG: hypothetical protein RJA86_564 [Pseudomonadota bacterium]|jgi:hypothetical protein